MMKKILTLIMIILFLNACSFSNPGENEDNNNESTEYRDEIKVGLDVDAVKLDPRLSNESTSNRVTEMVYSGLIKLNTNLEPEPDIAVDWESLDNKTWIFTLRDDVTFHDGEKLTSEDVKFTFDTILDPEFQSNSLTLFSPIESVEAIDETTVQFNLSEPYAPLLSYLDMGIVPKHIAENDPESLISEPVGSGPYKFIQWDKNNKISFEAFEDYVGDKPKTKKLTYYIIPDNSTRVASLESGDIDLVHSPLSASDVERMRDNDQFTLMEMEGFGYTYLNFNVQDEVVSDKLVRQAISHFVDKEVISQSIYRDMDTPGKSPLVPASWAYTDEVESYEYDIKKGKELLEQAGYSYSDADGFTDNDGNKLEIELATHTEDPNRIQAVEYIQNELMENGIETNVTTTEWSTFSDDLMNGSYQVALLGWLNLYDPDRATYNQFHSESGSNYGKYNNPKVDELLEEARSINDQDKRKELYQEVAQIVNEEVPYNVLLYQGYVVIHSKDLSGFEPVPNGSFNNLIYAEIEK